VRLQRHQPHLRAEVTTQQDPTFTWCPGRSPATESPKLNIRRERGREREREREERERERERERDRERKREKEKEREREREREILLGISSG